MAPNDYAEARKDATESGEELFCATIDGLPYFPNLVVPTSSLSSSLSSSSSSPLSSTEEERYAAIRKIVLAFVQKLRPDAYDAAAAAAATTTDGSSSSSWTVAPITGGNTNALYSVSGIEWGGAVAGGGAFASSSVLVRLFGAEGMIDRDAETATYHSLAKQGLALEWYGRFGNGRVEELLVGHQTLTERDLVLGFPPDPKLAEEGEEEDGSLSLLPPSNLNQEIARKLARLHSTCNIPSHLSGDGDGNGNGNEPTPTLWTQLYPWLERALEAQFLTERDTKRASEQLDPPLAELKSELDWLRSTVVGSSSSNNSSDASASTNTTFSGIGFCHNDLLASNIMMRTSSNSNKNARPVLEELHFIDFEYGGINYYAYDIANHFNEYAGGTAEEDNATPDYTRCPSSAHKRLFFEAYVDEFNQQRRQQQQQQQQQQNIATTQSLLLTVEQLEASVDGFSLANHLVWGLWGVLQAAIEGCEEGLDYLHYAKCRFDRYKHDKEILMLSLNKSSE